MQRHPVQAELVDRSQDFLHAPAQAAQLHRHHGVAGPHPLQQRQQPRAFGRGHRSRLAFPEGTAQVNGIAGPVGDAQLVFHRVEVTGAVRVDEGRRHENSSF
ncbi:hypothetical protein D3C81_1332250 [compost metagenome]